MKFTRAATFFALSAMAIAAPAPAPVAQTGNCDVGTLNCCNSSQSTGSLSFTQLLELLSLGLQIGQLIGNLGINCTPVTVGLGAPTCNASPFCCSGNTFSGGGLLGGLVTAGCTPITL